MTILIVSKKRAGEKIRRRMGIDAERVEYGIDALERIAEGGITALMTSYHGAGGEINLPHGIAFGQTLRDELGINRKAEPKSPLEYHAAQTDLFVAMYAIMHHVPKIGIFYTLEDYKRQSAIDHFTHESPQTQSIFGQLCNIPQDANERVGFSQCFIADRDTDMEYHWDQASDQNYTPAEVRGIIEQSGWSEEERQRLMQAMTSAEKGEQKKSAARAFLEYSDANPTENFRRYPDWRAMLDKLESDYEPFPSMQFGTYGL